MLSEASPIKIDAQSSDTFDKNVLKFILTGVDDSGPVPTRSREDQETANLGKIELIDELLAAAEEDLKQMFPGGGDVTQQELIAQQERLAERQSALNQLRRERRVTSRLRMPSRAVLTKSG